MYPTSYLLITYVVEDGCDSAIR